jgi:Rrf2 family protein
LFALTRKTDYALAALTDMASNSRNGASARDLSERLHLPLRALTNILNKLTHQGLVVSVRGAHGGYKLAKHPKDITLAELIEAVEGKVSLTRCSAGGNGRGRPCGRVDLCKVSRTMQQVHAVLVNYLTQVNLEHIASSSLPLEFWTAVPKKEPQDSSSKAPESVPQSD